MDPETAQIVLIAIAAAGAVVWLIALGFLIASARPRPAGVGDEGGLADEWPPEWLSGSTEVEGDAAELSTRAASLLARGTTFPGVPLKIVEKTDRHVRFERAGLLFGRRSPGSVLRGELRFTPAGQGRTRVAWGAEPSDLRFLLWLGGAFLAAGLVVLVTLCWALDTWVASSPDPTVRWQIFQMFQAVHFLWPPFLFGGLYRAGRKWAAAQLDAFANNLPHSG
jgi:hypothetical protein